MTIKTTLPLYSSLSNVVGTNNGSEDVIQSAGATQVAATYRLVAGLSKLPAGSTFTIVWQDGSSEKVVIENVMSSLGAVPIPGTQEAAGSSDGGGGGSGGGGSGGSGGGSDNPPPVHIPYGNGAWGCVSSNGGASWTCTFVPDQTGA